jgi:hypothetical protein
MKVEISIIYLAFLWQISYYFPGAELDAGMRFPEVTGLNFRRRKCLISLLAEPPWRPEC